MTETSENHDINFLLPSKKTTGHHVVEFLLLDVQEDNSAVHSSLNSYWSFHYVFNQSFMQWSMTITRVKLEMRVACSEYEYSS